MGTVDRLLKATEDIWASYHEKPFVQGLKYGTLDQKKFRSYIIQDYWYLMDYTKVFAIGVAKSKSVEIMKLFAKYIQAILDARSTFTTAIWPILGSPRRNWTTRLSSRITALTPPICSALPIGAVRRKS